MLSSRDDVKLCAFDDLIEQGGDGAAIGERGGSAAECVDDPFDSAIHFHESKVPTLCSQGCAAWT